MTNIKEEFLNHTINRQVKCVHLKTGYGYGDEEMRQHLLISNYNQDQLRSFLHSIDYCYDSGFGCQELHGTIWYTDGTWSERGEYDGSEWWEHKEVPDIPDVLKLLTGVFMTKQVEIAGVTYEAVDETHGCVGCAAEPNIHLCNNITNKAGCNYDDQIIWIKKEPMNTTEQANETVEVPPEEELKYTVDEFSEAFSNCVGVHVSDWDILQIKKYLDKQSNPDYKLYLELKAKFGE